LRTEFLFLSEAFLEEQEAKRFLFLIK